jgi:hypothetical protein
MKAFKYFFSVLFLLAVIITSCKKENNDTSFVNGVSIPTNLSVMFNITQDNTGLVTIIPAGQGASSYDIYFGDTSANPINIAAGKSVTHIYAEGDYSVKIIAHNITGKTTELDQPLTVSYRTPENLVATINVTGLITSITATATYATLFRVYYGDSTSAIPEPYTSFLAGQTATHIYPASGTYIITVVALSGGSESISYNDTVTVSTPIALPVTFDDANIDYTLTDFGGNQSFVVVDPTNSANKVLKSIKTAGSEVWSGVTIGPAVGFATPIPITATSTKMSLRVYAPAVGIDIKLKIEDHNDGTHSVETDQLTTVANQWDTLVFNFTNQAPTTTALNLSYTYDKASVFFDFGNAGDGRIYYADNLQMLLPGLSQINLPVTYDDPTVDYTVTDFGGNVSVVVADPTNSANKVLQSTKTAGAATYAGTTIGTALGFATPVPLTATSTMTVKVYSPAAGLDVKLKLEDHNDGTHSIETDALTTLANQWETITFNFSNPAPTTPAFNASYTYDKATLFFDFGNTETGSVFYSDDLKF